MHEIDEGQNWPKGNGKAKLPLGTRWIMRSSDGHIWQTTGYYTVEQVNRWDLSKPLIPIWNEVAT